MMGYWNRDDTEQRLRREAEYERDRYEALRDQVEREREQDYERQRQERHERIQASRASNRLYHGEIDDFGDAMRAVVSEVHDELGFVNAHADDLPGDGGASALEAYARAAEDAEHIWREQYQAFMNSLTLTVLSMLRKRMAETGNESYGQFADALNSDDYTGLAI